jgi:hypothetical protein
MGKWIYDRAKISLQVTNGPEDNTKVDFPEANQVEGNRERGATTIRSVRGPNDDGQWLAFMKLIKLRGIEREGRHNQECRST